MASPTEISNLTQQWMDSLERWHLDFFLIPTTVITLATMIVNPVLLACIFLSRALRQETRYLLVANTLTADLVFLIINLITVICNTLRVPIPWLACELVTASTVTTHTCTILTITFMVVDTFAAVRWPLHYHSILPPTRTQCILLGVWVVAALYPFSLVIMMEMDKKNPHEEVPLCLALLSLGFIQAKNIMLVNIYFFVAAFTCTLLIFYCYIRLYMVTRTQGIWQNPLSRARVTLRAHGLLLLLYFAPGIVFTVELSVFQKTDINEDVRVWISTVNMCFFMMLPRAFAPYLYGLRSFIWKLLFKVNVTFRA
ncbi:hypothetical protein Q5P01_022401 [Channa striata]|uniref:G-protein coupled receptors family 1 profile domain-containing protein n=1 Tax=Channa striata TaxID=64152 RepID=A0AA88IZK3_CHASR|nr:hypothetical protein Q5P01_022401 [Channa striata]